MDKLQDLISRLADGNFHSGETLAAQLGISRTAVWKRIKKLSEVDLDVYAIRGRGYRLPGRLEPLDSHCIRSHMERRASSNLAELTVVPMVDSTNRALFQQLDTRSVHAVALLAEYQRAGRGRRGNEWLSPYGSGLCLSIGWHFDSTPASITALSLADVEDAQANGERYKLIARATPSGGSVRLERLPLTDPLAQIKGATNAITYRTDLVGDVTVIGPGAGRSETGFGLLADLLALRRYA